MWGFMQERSYSIKVVLHAACTTTRDLLASCLRAIDISQVRIRNLHHSLLNLLGGGGGGAVGNKGIYSLYNPILRKNPQQVALNHPTSK